MCYWNSVEISATITGCTNYHFPVQIAIHAYLFWPRPVHIHQSFCVWIEKENNTLARSHTHTLTRTQIQIYWHIYMLLYFISLRPFIHLYICSSTLFFVHTSMHPVLQNMHSLFNSLINSFIRLPSYHYTIHLSIYLYIHPSIYAPPFYYTSSKTIPSQVTNNKIIISQ